MRRFTAVIFECYLKKGRGILFYRIFQFHSPKLLFVEAINSFYKAK